MRELLLRFVIGFAAFVIGIEVVFATGTFWKAEDEHAFIVEPIYKAEIGMPRFSAYGRGCGNGYVQSYETDDGQFVDEGVAAGFYTKEARRKVRKRVQDAKQVIERIPKFRNSRGEVGERIIIVNKPNKEGKESVSILFYDGGDSYRFIDAPTLDLALEFEQYLISIDFKSPI